MKDMKKAEEHIVLVLSKLELIFTPTFFDIMIHLFMNLPKEAILMGFVQMQWMYPFERFMKMLKEYVWNRARLEGSIAEQYVVNEALTFCSKYLKCEQTKFNRLERNPYLTKDSRKAQLPVFKLIGQPIGKVSTIRLEEKQRRVTEWYILNNCEEVQPYLE